MQATALLEPNQFKYRPVRHVDREGRKQVKGGGGRREAGLKRKMEGRREIGRQRSMEGMEGRKEEREEEGKCLF